MPYEARLRNKIRVHIYEIAYLEAGYSEGAKGSSGSACCLLVRFDEQPLRAGSPTVCSATSTLYRSLMAGQDQRRSGSCFLARDSCDGPVSAFPGQRMPWFKQQTEQPLLPPQRLRMGSPLRSKTHAASTGRLSSTSASSSSMKRVRGRCDQMSEQAPGNPLPLMVSSSTVRQLRGAAAFLRFEHRIRAARTDDARIEPCRSRRRAKPRAPGRHW